MFRTVPLSIIRSFSLHTQQWCISYLLTACEQDQDGTFSSILCTAKNSCWWTQELSSVLILLASYQQNMLWHVPLLCVQRKTPDDEQRNCPKHVVFCSKNKFQKSVRLVGFIVRIYHEARSAERQMCNNRQLCVWRYPKPTLLYST